jgi:SnoaL-like domain
MDDYILAWSTNDPSQIAGLFASDAVYDPQTAVGEHNGVSEIVAWWTEIDDDEENWEFEWQPLVEMDDLAVVTGRTRYIEPALSYRNLFVIRFDDNGLCYDFTEWYIEEASG